MSEVDKPDQLERNTLDLHKEAVRIPRRISACSTLNSVTETPPKYELLGGISPAFGLAFRLRALRR